MAAKPYCEKRNELMESLVELSIRLSIAASQMADLATLRDSAGVAKAKTEVERLRDECDNVRSQLERHRAQHGC